MVLNEVVKNSKLINSKGFTVLELVLALGLLTFVVAAVASFMMNLNNQSLNAQKKSDILTSKEIFGKVLKTYMGSAINTDWTSSNIGNLDSGRGRIRKYSSGLITNSTAAPITLALFLRDAGVNESDIRATALFYKQPSSRVPGKLLLGSSRPGTGAVTLSSNASEFELGSVVDLEIGVGGIDISVGEPVRVVKIKTVQRIFSSGDVNSWKWCPSSVVTAACRNTDAHSDVETFYYISLDKNLITKGTNRKETINGEMYLFQGVSKRN